MTRHFAAALIMAGFVPEIAPGRSYCTQSQGPASHVTVEARMASGLARPGVFGRLKSAGRYRRNELASYAFEEGRLWAEWGGYVRAEDPRFIETPELDAEWMAYAPSSSSEQGRWLLARRETQPSPDGRYWSVYASGWADPGRVSLVAVANHAILRDNSLIVRYFQRQQGVLLQCRARFASQVVPFNAAGSDLARVRGEYPELVRSYLAPAVSRICNLDLGSMPAI